MAESTEAPTSGEAENYTGFKGSRNSSHEIINQTARGGEFSYSNDLILPSWKLWERILIFQVRMALNVLPRAQGSQGK